MTHVRIRSSTLIHALFQRLVSKFHTIVTTSSSAVHVLVFCFRQSVISQSVQSAIYDELGVRVAVDVSNAWFATQVPEWVADETTTEPTLVRCLCLSHFTTLHQSF